MISNDFAERHANHGYPLPSPPIILNQRPLAKRARLLTLFFGANEFLTKNACLSG